MPNAARPRLRTRCERSTRPAASDMVRPEQPLRPDQQHQEEGDEPERVAISGCPESGADRLDDPEQEPAPDGPDDAAHPSEHGHDESFQGEDSTDRREDVERGQEQHARRHREHDSDAEHGGLHEACVHPLQLRRVAVLRRCADGAAEVGARQDQEETGDDEHGEREGDEERHRERDGGDADRLGRIRSVDGLRVRAEDEQERIAEDEPHPDGHEDERVLRRVLDGRKEYPLDEGAEEESGGRDSEERQVRVDVEGAEEREGDVHADGHELAVREVDDAHDAEDEREPDPHHGVDAAGEDARGDRLDEPDEVHQWVRLAWRFSQGGVGYAGSPEAVSFGQTTTNLPFCTWMMSEGAGFWLVKPFLSSKETGPNAVISFTSRSDLRTASRSVEPAFFIASATASRPPYDLAA